MFCPQCKCEYKPGYTRCADCGVDLVDRLPDSEEVHQIHDKRMDKTKLVPVLRTQDQADVVNIKMILDSAGVEYFLQGEVLMGIRRDDPVVLVVKEEDVAHVRDLLKEIKLNFSSSVFNPKRRR